VHTVIEKALCANFDRDSKCNKDLVVVGNEIKPSTPRYNKSYEQQQQQQQQGRAQARQSAGAHVAVMKDEEGDGGTEGRRQPSAKTAGHVI
jgi:hypothetical protein